MFGISMYGIAIASLLGFIIFIAIAFRIVVSTNDVHIVQSAKRTISYGKGQDAGNVYYKWPAWVPHFGVRVTSFPVSVFDVALDAYSAYDKGRVPFVIDIIAFFRITDSDMAAQRVFSFDELKEQLSLILKGAIRTILASSEIEEILEGRSKFGEMFTKEVDDQLKQWGVQTVKCIELMDIRDASNSEVIQNIMAKNKSKIEKESRVAVAGNIQAAQVAEVEAMQTVETRKLEAQEVVGKRKAEADKQIGIATQQAQQLIKEEEKNTAVKAMAIVEVNSVRQAEITRSTQIILADQSKQVLVTNSNATKEQTVILADGNLEAAKRNAEAIEVQGNAKGAAETALLMAPVNSQITLAKEIGANKEYQTYLISVRTIEANQAVGIEQAKALTAAEIKVIANSGSMVDGVSNVMEMFSAKGGTQLGGMLEALKNTEVGAKFIDTFTTKK